MLGQLDITGLLIRAKRVISKWFLHGNLLIKIIFVVAIMVKE
jgi:hypothetical protein